jgi:hypothetical protein
MGDAQDELARAAMAASGLKKPGKMIGATTIA